MPVAEEGQVVRFNLFGDSSFNYVVTVPTAEGQYVFSGNIRNQDKEERTSLGPQAVPRRTAANACADVDAHADAHGNGHAGTHGHANA